MILLLQILSGLVLAYLSFGVAYQLCFAILGRFYQQMPLTLPSSASRIVVLIPGYKEDAVIISTAQQALNQRYPKEKYEVIIIADSFKPETLAALAKLPIRVEEVSFEQSTKSKAINTVLNRLPEDAYDLLVILDADNVMATDFLERMVVLYEQGNRAMQGQRAAKNLDTPMAVLDGASEAINNHILCKGHRQLGLSARLAGSAMAFDYQLFRAVMPEVDAVGGFDKELELRLTQKGVRIAYDDAAIVYDEKVRKSKDFSRQRSRWIAAQFQYAQLFFPKALLGFFRTGNIDFLNKATQMLLPPRLITPGVLALGAVLHILLGAWYWAVLWSIVFVANILSFLLAMPAFVWEAKHRKALWQLPMAFVAALGSLLKLGQARRHFINTPHGTNE